MPAAAELQQHLAAARQAMTAGRFGPAEAAARRALALEPGHTAAHQTLVLALLQQGRLGEANDAIDLALQQAGERPELLALAGDARQMAGRLDEAEPFLCRALTLTPGNTVLRFQHAHLMLAQGRFDDALALFRQLARGHSYRDEALAGVAHCQERLGHIEDAQRNMDEALRHSRNPSAFILRTLADVASQSGQTGPAIERLRGRLGGAGLGRDQAGALHMSLGRLLDRSGAYREALEHFHQGNRLLAPDHDWRTLGGRYDALRQRFGPHSLPATPLVKTVSQRPIFIVGLPRSGTSLVERILSAHPEVAAGGELEDIHHINLRLGRRAGVPDPGPVELARLGTDALEQEVQGYLARLERISPDARHVTDKMPGNISYLGLIALLFPGARVIHCVRDPLDTCLSCYFQPFNRSNALAYTFDLEALAWTWTAQEGLMEHWKKVLQLPIMDLRYETLVRDFAQTARSLLDFCGLEWDTRVLSYHRTESHCTTASYEQVRQPVYTRSVGRWKHYAPWIGDLIRAFENTGYPD